MPRAAAQLATVWLVLPLRRARRRLRRRVARPRRGRALRCAGDRRRPRARRVGDLPPAPRRCLAPASASATAVAQRLLDLFERDRQHEERAGGEMPGERGRAPVAHVDDREPGTASPQLHGEPVRVLPTRVEHEHVAGERARRVGRRARSCPSSATICSSSCRMLAAGCAIRMRATLTATATRM